MRMSSARKCVQDPRFNKDIDKKTGYRTKNILSMPILDNEGEVVGVAQIVNKMSNDQTSFSSADEEVHISCNNSHDKKYMRPSCPSVI